MLQRKVKCDTCGETYPSSWPHQCELPPVVSVMKIPPQLGAGTLCRLMDDCLPDQIEDEQDMQKLIDKLWPALCCEFEIAP